MDATLLWGVIAQAVLVLASVAVIALGLAFCWRAKR